MGWRDVRGARRDVHRPQRPVRDPPVGVRPRAREVRPAFQGHRRPGDAARHANSIGLYRLGIRVAGAEQQCRAVPCVQGEAAVEPDENVAWLGLVPRHLHSGFGLLAGPRVQGDAGRGISSAHQPRRSGGIVVPHTAFEFRAHHPQGHAARRDPYARIPYGTAHPPAGAVRRRGIGRFARARLPRFRRERLVHRRRQQRDELLADRSETCSGQACSRQSVPWTRTVGRAEAGALRPTVFRRSADRRGGARGSSGCVAARGFRRGRMLLARAGLARLRIPAPDLRTALDREPHQLGLEAAVHQIPLQKFRFGEARVVRGTGVVVHRLLAGPARAAFHDVRPGPSRVALRRRGHRQELDAQIRVGGRVEVEGAAQFGAQPRQLGAQCDEKRSVTPESGRSA